MRDLPKRVKVTYLDWRCEKAGVAYDLFSHQVNQFRS